MRPSRIDATRRNIHATAVALVASLVRLPAYVIAIFGRADEAYDDELKRTAGERTRLYIMANIDTIPQALLDQLPGEVDGVPTTLAIELCIGGTDPGD